MIAICIISHDLLSSIDMVAADQSKKFSIIHVVIHRFIDSTQDMSIYLKIFLADDINAFVSHLIPVVNFFSV